MTSFEKKVAALGFSGFHRESLNEPTYRGNLLLSNDISINIPKFMERKCFWELSTGWIVRRPKNLIPKKEYNEYATTNVTYIDMEFITWPTLKNDSKYSRMVRNKFKESLQDLKKDLITWKYSPLYCIWVFHGNTYKGKYYVMKIEEKGIWIKKFN